MKTYQGETVVMDCPSPSPPTLSPYRPLPRTSRLRYHYHPHAHKAFTLYGHTRCLFPLHSNVRDKTAFIQMTQAVNARFTLLFYYPGYVARSAACGTPTHVSSGKRGCGRVLTIVWDQINQIMMTAACFQGHLHSPTFRLRSHCSS